MTFQKRSHPRHFAFADDSPWMRCIDSWILENYQRSHSEQTRKRYTDVIVGFFNAVQKTPDQVLRSDVLEWIHSPCLSDRNRGDPPTIGTVHNRLSILASFYRYCSVYTVASASGLPEPILKYAPPTVNMKAPKPAIAIRALSLDELSRLIAAIPTNTIIGLRDRALVWLYVLTARRRSEVYALTWGSIREDILVDEGGHARTGLIYQYRNKGSEGLDTSELPRMAYEHICRYLAAAGRLESIKESDPIFEPVMNGSKSSTQLTGTSVNRRIKVYARRAGLPGTISLHNLRHTSASLRVQSGAHLLDVMRALNHQSLDHTFRYVQRIANPSDRDAIKLEAMFAQFS